MSFDLSNMYNEEAEKEVLGAMLVNSEDVVPEAVNLLSVSNDIFHNKAHQLIYNAILTCYHSRGKADAILVSEELESTNNLNRVGGNVYLYDLQSKTVDASPENARYYIDLISELTHRRRTSILCQRISDQALDTSKSIDDVLSSMITNASSLSESMSIEEMNTKNSFEIMAAEYPDRPSIIPGIIPQGLVLVAGPAKSGKSYAMLNLAYAAAMGGVAWGNQSINQSFNTLYIAFEAHFREIQVRTARILGNHEAPENLYFLEMDKDKSTWGWEFDTRGLKMLTKFVTDNDIKLVIIDTWERSRPVKKAVNGNAYEKDSQLLAPVYDLAKMLNITIILTHHTRKAVDPENPFNEISGSMGMQAIPDAMLMLRPHDGSLKRLHVTGREMPPQEFGLVVDVEQLGVVTLMEEDAIPPNITPEKQNILDILGNGAETVADVVKATDKTDNAIRVFLNRLIKDGLVKRTSRGIYALKDGSPEITF